MHSCRLTHASWLLATSKEAFLPICQLSDSEGHYFPNTAEFRLSAASIKKSDLPVSVFPTVTIPMPGLLITEVSPAGKWTERLWEGDRDERRFEKCKLCLDLIFSV